MEQSVNLFNKGLLMDSHPMVLGNDTLTDALNATFITMNGNEVVLQNDMGNRRIDNAYLPTGYEPVGIKEYGGVIYVAAYNPITGRGQVGSFPSPQRKLSIGNKQGEDLNLNMFIEHVSGTLYKVATRNITIPISDDVVLHTGDKFSVYSNDISNLILYLTKPGDVKNNLFTFQVGLFNSLNEFVDISDKLKLKNLGTELDPYDYYIWDDNGVNDLSHTINDAEFNKNRNALAINTYSYKMSSPLYLRAILNAPTNITYNIDGEKDGNNLTIFLEVTYTYNCLDDINNNHFSILFNNTLCNPLGTFNSVYNEELDNYSVTLNYEYTVLNNTSQFHYDIDFLLLNNYSEWSSKNIILSEFSVSADLDTTKLHSDLVELNGYRYYVDTNNKKITLDIDINSYPKKNSSYDIYPVIYKNGESDPYELIEYKLPTTDNKPKSGTYQLEIYYNTIISAQHNNHLTGVTLEYGYKYEIRFKLYGTVTTNNIVNAQGTAASGLLIITPLFNGNYIGTSSYKSTTLTNNGGYNYDLAKNDYIKDFSTIKYLILSPILSTTSSQLIYDRTIEKDGKYVYELSESGEKTYNIKESYMSDTNINVGVTLNNAELYPQEVLNALLLGSVSINSVYRYINGNEVSIDNSNNSEYSENLTEIRGDYNETPNPVIKINQHNTVNNNIILILSDITINNYVKGELVENNNIICNRVITSLYDFIKSNYGSSNNITYNIHPPYICVDWEGENSVAVTVDSGSFKDNTREDNGIVLVTTTPTESCLNLINTILKSGSENFLLLDYNSDDTVIGDGPCYVACEDNANNENNGDHLRGIRRIWMKISEKEYTPISTESWAPTSENLSQEVFELGDNHYGVLNIGSDEHHNSNPFPYAVRNIPHYYAYSQDGITLDKNVINHLELIKTKEFNIPSLLKVLLTGTVTLDDDNNSYYFQLENQPYTTDANIEISEPNLKSTEGIDEYLEKINNISFDCVLSRPTSNLYNSERVIEYEDREGNLFDPLYVYYQFNETEPSSKFLKSYKAKTFYTSDLKQNMPELKSSDELFHASNGRVHPYINPNVIGSVERLELVVKSKIGWNSVTTSSTSQFLDMINGRFASTSENLVGLNNITTISLPPFMVYNPPYHSGQYYWDKDFSCAQYEAEGGGILIWTPLTCKNIFNQKSIIEFKLYKNINRNSDCPIDSGWISADACYNLLESPS